MIKVGDRVRFSNEYLKSIGSRRGRNYKLRRGKQRIMKVLRVYRTVWDWRSRKSNTIVTVLVGDSTKAISTYWLRFVYRPKQKVAENLTVGIASH